MPQFRYIPSDIREEELVQTIIDTLKQIDRAIEATFTAIDTKLSQFNSRIDEIDERSNQVRLKINRLREASSKVTKVFSNYKYPVKSSFKEYEPLSSLFNRNDFKYDKNDKIIDAPHVPFDDESLKQQIKLAYFFASKEEPSNDLIDFKEGPLGPIPWPLISSIGSLVMFNKSENPFIRSSGGSSIFETKLKQRKAQDVLDESVTSIQRSFSGKNEENEEKVLRYNPDIQSAPKLIDQLPTALPDLEGIADDLTFDDFDIPSTSPLPPFERSVSSAAISVASPPPPPPPSPPPSPPPLAILNKKETPPPPPAVILDKNETTSSPPPPPISLSPPPPPPPPPPPQSDLQKETEKPTAKPTASGDRAGLLASIREAGGKPKKRAVTIKERKIEEKRQDKSSVKTDFMSDLQKTLNARRIGISGKSVRRSNDESLLQKTASMFMESSSSESSDSSDENWTD